MIDLGTGFIIEIMIESAVGNEMRDLDFSVDFFVYTNRRKVFQKSDLVCIEMESANRYYALLNTSEIGCGKLMARVTVKDPVAQWAGGKRPVILMVDTGKTVGEDRHFVSNRMPLRTPDFEEGYRVSFNFVWGLPKPDVAYIFYGNIVDQIASMDEISSEMLVSPDNHIVSVRADKMGKTSCGTINMGSKVIVLIPEDRQLTATKDNGFGGKMAFSTQIMGANGEPVVTIDGTRYKVYGELMAVSGEVFIYVD
ncbi:MAG: hypothetical protein SPE11_07715 [Parabacteroides sp.]|nr:hypothetical protein [Parabacteroides sp.]